MRVSSDIRDSLFDIYGPKGGRTLEVESHHDLEESFEALRGQVCYDYKHACELAEAIANNDMRLSRSQRKAAYQECETLGFFSKYLDALHNELELAKHHLTEDSDKRIEKVYDALRKLRHVAELPVPDRDAYRD